MCIHGIPPSVNANLLECILYVDIKYAFGSSCSREMLMEMETGELSEGQHTFESLTFLCGYIHTADRNPEVK